MADQQDINYPDVLGLVTKDTRHTIGPVQMALTTRPQAVKAGKPFEVILLIQNTIDAPVDVTLTLQLPDKDANGQKGRFLHGTDRLVVGLAAAEVGYALLPMSTLPDTAPSDKYTIGLDIAVKAIEKGDQVRRGNGSAFDPKSLPKDQRKHIAELANLTFSAKKRGFLRGNALETTVNIQPGKVGSPLQLKAGWHSLWTMETDSDTDLLLARYREVMQHRVVPALTRKGLFKPLHDKVTATFSKAGYPLMDIEAVCITKLMVLILEYAQSSRNAQAILEAGIYDIDAHLSGTSFDSGGERQYPHWFDKMLRALAHDERIAKVPVKGLVHFAFFELMYDAMMHGFALVGKSSGEDLGTPEEMQAYAENALAAIKDKQSLDFSTVYMPLVLGGVLAYDRVMMKDETLSEGLNELKYLLDDRAEERNESTEMIFVLAKRVIDQSLKKYGSLDNRL